MGIEPTPSAWKAEVLPLNYTRDQTLVVGAGFEPAKAEPSDLQSDPFDRSGTPPKHAICEAIIFHENHPSVKTLYFFSSKYSSILCLCVTQLASSITQSSILRYLTGTFYA